MKTHTFFILATGNTSLTLFKTSIYIGLLILYFVLTSGIVFFIYIIGHGPYSHMYDGVFVPLTNPESTWTVSMKHCVCYEIMCR